MSKRLEGRGPEISNVASWFETAQARLLTMRVYDTVRLKPEHLGSRQRTKRDHERGGNRVPGGNEQRRIVGTV